MLDKQAKNEEVVVSASEVNQDRRGFTQGVLKALGAVAVGAFATRAIAQTTTTPSPSDSTADPETIKKQLLERIKSDLSQDIVPVDGGGDTSCYDKGPADDHYKKGSC